MGWLNDDGLYVKFGTAEGAAGVAGEYSTLGHHRVVEIKVDLTLLNTSTDTILEDNVWLPKNAFIEEVEVEVLEDVAGTSSTIDIGLIKTDRSTAFDANGLVAAEVEATWATAGNRVQYIASTSKAGALIGTTLAQNGLFVAKAGTAVLDTGLVAVRVKYSFA